MKELDDVGRLLPALGPGARVAIHSGCAEPRRLTGALGQLGGPLEGVTLYNLMPMVQPAYAGLPGSSVSIRTFFAGRGLRGAPAGTVESLRVPLSRIAGLFDEGEVRVDVLLLHLSPPDADGRMSLGVSVDYMPAVLRTNPLVVAEIDPAMPRTCGATTVGGDEVDFCVTSEDGPQTVPPTAPDDCDSRIAERVADLVPPRAVLQAGIGAIPDLVLDRLARGGPCGLGVHTGVITDAMLGLLRDGGVGNGRKKVFPGRTVATMAVGTQALYDFVHGNPAVEFHPCAVTHSPQVLSQIDGLCAVNSVLQIDLEGRANAEQIDGRLIAGPGGLPDFSSGARSARGGVSIISLRSTSRDGARSNIVRSLPDGAPVTITADAIDFVVTEYGVARIGGLGPAQRRGALIRIAHPNFRADLARHIA